MPTQLAESGGSSWASEVPSLGHSFLEHRVRCHSLTSSMTRPQTRRIGAPSAEYPSRQDNVFFEVLTAFDQYSMILFITNIRNCVVPSGGPAV